MASTRVAEIEHVQKWAAANNLCLNHSKSAEIIFTKSRLNTKHPIQSTTTDSWNPTGQIDQNSGSYDKR